MDAGALLGIIGSVFGIVLVVATVVAYFRASLAKATIDTLKESNAALTERVTILEREQEAHKIKTEALERENATLRDLMSGRADLSELVKAITDHHHAVMEDRAHFENRFSTAFIEMGERVDRVARMTFDVQRMMGGQRSAPFADPIANPGGDG